MESKFSATSPLALGMDTGGTYTDAILLDLETSQVRSTAKALTTHQDLSRGLIAGVDALGEFEPGQIRMVSISTTLATNALVEGSFRPVGLILIGYDERSLMEHDIFREFPFAQIRFVRGGHDVDGEEVLPLDEDGLIAAVRELLPRVEAFAVSGYFAPRNPGQERRAGEIIQELCSLPFSCGHELTQQLNAIKRAIHTALNASLIPYISQFIHSVQAALEEKGIRAPLMIVKGDGSLIAAELACRHPIETILSGPAASAIGAHFLSKVEEGLVVDMGGTTTDIAFIRNGRPQLVHHGASIDGRQTMVEAIDIQTSGLGGDSRVTLSEEGQLLVGPRRVIPLCRLAMDYPPIIPQLELRGSKARLWEKPTCFILPGKRPSAGWPPAFEILDEGPIRYSELLPAGIGILRPRQLEELIRAGAVYLADFTPTDALHVLGILNHWDARAAFAGAILLADLSGDTPQGFSRRVIEKLEKQAARSIIDKALKDSHAYSVHQHITADYLLEQSLSPTAGERFAVSLKLQQPIIAVGAPAEAYFPAVAGLLHTSLIIPPHAEVANAVGAVAGSILCRLSLAIRRLPGGQFRLLGLPQIYDFAHLAEALDFATRNGESSAREQCRAAGAAEIQCSMERKDIIVKAGSGWEEDVFVGADLHFSAIGRPQMAAGEISPAE
jgi:N-methylhydantoinase A/oxoprolinase/acetone carboxylase beta subunit